MITKNPLSTLLSTSEGLVVVVVIGVLWQIFGYLNAEQTFDDATNNMIEIGLWWMGLRTGLKGVEKGAEALGGKVSPSQDMVEGMILTAIDKMQNGGKK